MFRQLSHVVIATNMEAGGTNQSGNNEALLSLESALLTACETLSGLASLAVDFQYDSQDLLFAKVYVNQVSPACATVGY